MKLVPDQSQGAAEKKLLEGLGFTVIDITCAPVGPVSPGLLREDRGLR
jgi:hypothetical protein